VTSVKELDAAIEAHCEVRAEFRRERTRVALCELSGMPSPELVKEIEGRLTRVYTMLDECSRELAAIAAETEFGE
jgi:hypothetical protein